MISAGFTRAALCLLVASLLSSCSAPADVTVSRFDDDLVLVTRIVSSGGTLGEETYTIFARYDGRDVRFFEGVNPSKGFALFKKGGSIGVRFCDGTVHLAQPVFLGSPEYRLIPLHLVMDCPAA